MLNAKQHFREAEIVAQAGRRARSPSRRTWPAEASTSSSAATPRRWPTRELRGQGLEPGTEEWEAALGAATPAATKRECARAHEIVREAGGLYVLGSERHESRRIDNQLRGRSGRQGDPGESRFFLSLEDELMRLFATGAVSWVMDRTIPDDQPIEAKMVTKAIERAQNTVEGRNAEQRKDVLKYDDVMNEQRKVIYARRLQILENEDLHQRTLDLLDEAAQTLVLRACPSEYKEEWDLHAPRSSRRRSTGRSRSSVEQLDACATARRAHRGRCSTTASTTTSSTARRSPAARRWPGRSSAT